ncbi:hypothetical protein SynPROSU1_02121 [Synechococcus sp. PROS-U-1]|nr:hypothetical protein SynPROSU1_02121 [Synechococcus sp. PROS-U-1]
MSESKTVEGWLIWLDQQRPSQEMWDDSQYLHLISEIMIWCIPRRCSQMLIDAGAALDVRPEYR